MLTKAGRITTNEPPEGNFTSLKSRFDLRFDLIAVKQRDVVQYVLPC